MIPSAPFPVEIFFKGSGLFSCFGLLSDINIIRKGERICTKVIPWNLQEEH